MSLLRDTFTHIRSFSLPFWIIIIATLMNQIGNMAFVFLMLYLSKHLHYSLIQASFVFGAFCVATLLTGIYSGILINKFNALSTLIGSLLLNGIILLFIPLAHNYILIFVLCFLWGSTYGLYRPASQTLITYLSKPGLHKVTFSLYRLAINLGMSIGPAIGAYFATHSFTLIFIVNGISNLIACLILYQGIKRPTWLNFSSEIPNKLKYTFKIIKDDAVFTLFLIATIPISMVFFQHESTLPIFLNKDLSLPLSFYGWLFTLNTLLIVFFELPLNVFTLNWSYKINFLIGTFFIGIAFVCLAWTTKEWQIILLTVVWTIGEMVLYPAASSFVAEIASKQERANYMSLFSVSTNFSMLLGPCSGAVIFQKFGASPLWLFCGFLSLISIWLFYKMKIPKLKHALVN